MIQWKANSVKSDTLEQLLQPAELCNGLTPEQVIAALKVIVFLFVVVFSSPFCCLNDVLLVE
jgi:hypothetical protein